MKSQIESLTLNHESVQDVVTYLGRYAPSWGDIDIPTIRALTICDTDNPELLRDWCNEFLQPHHWRRMQNYFLKRRERARRKVNGTDRVTVTLERSAWAKLSSLAKDEHISISEAINRHLTA